MDRPTGSAHLNIALAAVCAGGGAMGYLRKGSVPSLVAGLACAGAYSYAAYLINDPAGDPATGHLTGFGTSVVLGTAMGMRLVRTGKALPAGPLMAGGLLAAMYNWGKYKEWSGAA